MKFYTLLFSLILLWSCNKGESVFDIEPCTDDKYDLPVQSVLKNVRGVIKTDLYYESNDEYNFYVIEEIEQGTFGGLYIPLYPCNLPEDMEVYGLEIIFSGNILKLDDYIVFDLLAQPFELTSIKVASQDQN